MQLEGMDHYKLDKAFTEGVNIELDHANAVFRVRLPSQYNRTYQRILAEGMKLEIQDDGRVTPSADLGVMAETQRTAFIQGCLLAVNRQGLSTAEREQFADEYPAAIDELMQKAQAMAQALDKGVDAAAKKSPPISSGSTDGAADSIPTGALRAAGN